MFLHTAAQKLNSSAHKGSNVILLEMHKFREFTPTLKTATFPKPDGAPPLYQGMYVELLVHT